jgi:hypothetical protein
MAIRLCVASLLVSVNFIGFSFAAFSADYADIPRFGIWETHDSCSFKGSFNINICHAGTIVRTSQQTITSEPRRTTEPKIVGVSVPPDSSDGPSWSYETRLWSTEFPLRDANRIGIGYIVELEPFYRIWSEADFVMHDHMYLAPGVPDPRRANITYHFSDPAKISEVLIIQHTNGIGQIEGFVGNDERNMQSIGHANSTRGADLPLKENTFPEGYRDVFKFERGGEGKVFRIVITKTPLPNGYALYRAYPRNGDHRPYEALRIE